MAGVEIVPSRSDAQRSAFTGATLWQPRLYTVDSGKRVDERFLVDPVNEILALIYGAQRAFEVPVRNASGGNFAAGTLVYIANYASGIRTVEAAGAGKPATLILLEALADSTNGYAYPLGSITYNTSGKTVGQEVYLDMSTALGALTFTAPTLGTQSVQVVGHVSTVDAVTGTIDICLLENVWKWGSQNVQPRAIGAPELAYASVVDLADADATLTTSCHMKIHDARNFTGGHTITLPALASGIVTGFRANAQVLRVAAAGSDKFSLIGTDYSSVYSGEADSVLWIFGSNKWVFSGAPSGIWTPTV